MEDQFNSIYYILLIYAIPCVLITLAGIVVTVIGYGKEQKNLKLAGVVVTIIGAKLVVILALFALYMRFIIS